MHDARFFFYLSYTLRGHNEPTTTLCNDTTYFWATRQSSWDCRKTVIRIFCIVASTCCREAKIEHAPFWLYDCLWYLCLVGVVSMSHDSRKIVSLIFYFIMCTCRYVVLETPFPLGRLQISNVTKSADILNRFAC